MSVLILARAIRRALLAGDLIALGRAYKNLQEYIGPEKAYQLFRRLSRRF